MNNNYRMQVELTNHCNFRCRLCPHSQYRRGPGPAGNVFDREKGYMEPELWRECLKAAEKHAKVLTLGFFGEQMLHPRFSMLLFEVHDFNPYRVDLNTNWALATPGMFHLIEQKVDRLKISLDSIVPQTFDVLCPAGLVVGMDGQAGWFESRLSDLIEKIKAWLERPTHCPTEIVFVTSELNKDEREDFAAYWKPHLGPHDAVVQKTAISYGGVVEDSHMTGHPCPVPVSRFTVAWDGRMTPCNLDVNLALAVGRVKTAEDIDRILGSIDWAARLAQIRDRESICANCPDANNRAGLRVIRGER